MRARRPSQWWWTRRWGTRAPHPGFQPPAHGPAAPVPPWPSPPSTVQGGSRTQRVVLPQTRASLAGGGGGHGEGGWDTWWGPGGALGRPWRSPRVLQTPLNVRLGPGSARGGRLTRRCASFAPGRAEYQQICLRTAVGLMVMGFVGFFVKLVFIPIKSIILGA